MYKHFLRSMSRFAVLIYISITRIIFRHYCNEFGIESSLKWAVCFLECQVGHNFINSGLQI